MKSFFGILEISRQGDAYARKKRHNSLMELILEERIFMAVQNIGKLKLESKKYFKRSIENKFYHLKFISHTNIYIMYSE